MAQNVIINGVTYNSVPQVNIPLNNGGSAQFYDPSDATATQNDILTGTNAYIAGGKKSGSMPNNGSTGGTISAKADSIAIPSGYTSGGTVSIAAAQQSLLIGDNIKAGVTILGVTGSTNVVDTSLASGAAGTTQILNGYSAYVNGLKVDGSATVPTISQDSTTKVLTIS